MKNRSIAIWMAVLLLVLGLGTSVVSADITVRVELKASDGSPIDGGTVKYNNDNGGWKPFGTTGETGPGYVEKGLLEATIDLKVRVSYAGMSQTKIQNVQAKPTFAFQTVKAVVILEDCQGNGLPGGVVTYTAGKQRNFGITGADGEVHKELFPETIRFRMVYNNTRQDMIQNTNNLVVFQTGRVVQGTGNICTHYRANGWHEFTSGIELMPGLRKFRFIGMPDTQYEVRAGLVLTVPAGTYLDSPPKMDPIAEMQGNWYNSTPVISHLGFDDETALDDGWYQVDSYTGTWTPLFTDVIGTSWNTYNWSMPGFDALSEGSHTMYFKASDDVGNIEGESGEWSWQFYKDTQPPNDPTFVLSNPPLSIWTSGDTVVVRWVDGVDPSPGSGLSGYSIEWSTVSTTLPDKTQDIAADVQIAVNPALGDGQWYFHMRAVDNAGNWQSTVHWGPQNIDKIHGPTMEPILEPQSQWYKKAPILSNFGFDDNYALDDGWYQIDSYTGTWISLFTDAPGDSWDNDDWSIPGFDALSEGNHTIYFRATDDAGNAGGGSEWSWQFYKDTEPPTIPVLIQPADSSLLADCTPTFTWRASADDMCGVAQYELIYANNPAFASPYVKYLTDTTYTPTSPINAEIIYWMVKAIDATGNSSLWSDKWYFTFDVEALLPPTLNLPIGGIWLDDTLVTFEWAPVTHKGHKGDGTPVHYILQVDNNYLFASPFTDTTDAAYFTLILPEGLYYWRVKVYDEVGNQGIFSNPDSFGVDMIPPSEPTLISPPDSSVTNNPILTFFWHVSTDTLCGVDHYLLQYSRNSAFIFYCTDTVYLTDTSYVSDSLADGRYWWHVRGVDEAGNCVWSTVREFIINTTIPKVPTLISPADFCYISTMTPTFVWNSTSDRYRLQIALDKTFDALVIDTCGLIDTFYAVSDSSLFDTLTYYWRVEAISGSGSHSGYQVPPFMFTIDTHAPIFTGTTIWTDTSYLGPYPISAVIIDAVSGVSSAFIYYSLDEGNTWNAIDMQASTPDTYKTDIPEVGNTNVTVQYYLEAKDIAGNVARDPLGSKVNSYSFIVGTVGGGNTGIALQNEAHSILALCQNLPNPFAQTTTIFYQLPVQSEVNLMIYNITGQEVKTLVKSKQEAGHYNVKWDGKDNLGRNVTDGVYFYKMQLITDYGTSIHTYVNKMVLLR